MTKEQKVLERMRKTNYTSYLNYMQMPVSSVFDYYDGLIIERKTKKTEKETD